MKSIIAVTALAALAGCATFSPDGGFGAVGTAVKDRGLREEIKWIKTGSDAEQAQVAVQKLLAAPLTAESAVQIALLNNRGLQATYAELGIAESDLLQAGRLPNPGFIFERLSRGGLVSIERTFRSASWASSRCRPAPTLSAGASRWHRIAWRPKR